jgi:hypothetical protein
VASRHRRRRGFVGTDAVVGFVDRDAVVGFVGRHAGGDAGAGAPTPPPDGIAWCYRYDPKS